MGIDVKTFKRWKMDLEDIRKGPLTSPANKLTEAEVSEVIRVSTSAEYVDLAPTQIKQAPTCSVGSATKTGAKVRKESAYHRLL